MAYQALYRQWRPVNFAGLVGQEHIAQALRYQVATGKIGHAYLFCGSRGTGKTSTAKIFARAVNCLKPMDGDACGVCENCRRSLADENLDIIEIDAASNNSVDNVRDLRDSIMFPPQFGKFKVYIIDEVHMLSSSAFNALLKTLEEPPAHVIFILATTEPQKLLATILSRGQRYDFGRIPADKIAARLREACEGAGAEATDEALHQIARAAEGGMRDALSILDLCIGYGQKVDSRLVRTVLGTSDRAFLFRFAEGLQNEDAGLLMEMVDELMRSGREAMVFVQEIAEHLRALMLAKAVPEGLDALLEITREDAEAYLGQADGFTDTRLLSMIDVFMAAESNLRYTSSPRIALETAVLKACLRTGETDTAALQERIAFLESQMKRIQEQISSGALQRCSPKAAAKQDTHPSSFSLPDATAKVLTPTGRKADDIWKETMNALKKTEPSIFNMLSLGRYMKTDGTHYVWEAPAGGDQYTVYLMQPDRARKINDLLTEYAGTESSIEAIQKGGKAKSVQEDQSLENLITTFGGEGIFTTQE